MNSSKGYYTAQSLVILTFTCMDWHLNFNTRFIKNVECYWNGKK